MNKLNGSFMIKIKSTRHQRGFSLIEVMISLVLGFVLLLGISTLFMNTSRIIGQSETQSQLDNSAQMIFTRLRNDISMAGYVDYFDVSSPSSAMDDYQIKKIAAFGDKEIQDILTRTSGYKDTLFSKIFGYPALMGCPDGINEKGECTGSSTPKAQQSFQIAYQGISHKKSSAPLFAATGNKNDDFGSGYDCLGNEVENYFIVNQYFIARDSKDSNHYALFCRGSGDTSQSSPIVKGVEQMVLHYQTAEPAPIAANDAYYTTSGGKANRYLSADKVNPNWADVIAIDVCVIIAGENTSNSKENWASTQPKVPTCERTADGSAYKDPIIRPKDDRRLWRRYVTSIALPNVIYASPVTSTLNNP